MDNYYGLAAYRRLDGDYAAKREPHSLLAAARQLAEAQLQQRPPVLTTTRRSFENEQIGYEKALSRRTGLLLGRCVTRATSVNQFLVSIGAVHQWLPDCGLEIQLGHTWPPLDASLPLSEIRERIIDKVITSAWIDNIDTIDQIVTGMEPLFQPQEKEGPTFSFAQGFTLAVWKDLTAMPEGDRTKKIIVFYSALTDRGLFDEIMWGRIGIGRYHPNTAFSITEETWRRFVLEYRDCYVPTDKNTHTTTLGKYCFNLLKHVQADPERNQSAAAFIRRLLGDRDQLLMPLGSMVAAANAITSGINRTRKPHERQQLLPENNPAFTGLALARILQASRLPQRDEYDRQAYTDSVHVDIVHELSLFDFSSSRPRRGPYKHDQRLAQILALLTSEC
ncbi:MAG TPA: hypothetical protein VFB59_01435 [Candidatus Saccharimonadales bacterium]|nr:hypothetical protein [Candidatus Saccharimonadales bacterium]